MADNHFQGRVPSIEEENSDRQSEECMKKGSHKPLTVTFQNVTLTTKASGVDYGPTVLSEINPLNWINSRKMNASEKVSLVMSMQIAW